MVVIKGHDIIPVIAKDSFGRRALQYKNRIISALKKIGAIEDSIDVPLEMVAIKRVQASASWYLEGKNLYISHQATGRFVDNLYVLSKLIELEVNGVLDGSIDINEFINTFSEEDDIDKERIRARETLGVSHDTKDMAVITKQYKTLAKDFHPDMPNGDHERFKEINRAHKILKRELE